MVRCKSPLFAFLDFQCIVLPTTVLWGGGKNLIVQKPNFHFESQVDGECLLMYASLPILEFIWGPSSVMISILSAE